MTIRTVLFWVTMLIAFDGLGQARDSRQMVAENRISIMDAITRVETGRDIEFRQVIFVLALATAGFITVAAVRGTSEPCFTALLAFPAGTALWSGAGSVQYSTTGSATPNGYIGVMVTLLIGCVVVCHVRNRTSLRLNIAVRYVCHLLATIVVLGLVCTAVNRLALNVMTADSWAIVGLAHDLVPLTNSANDLLPFHSFPFFPVAMHSAGRCFGFELFHLYQPLVAFHILAVLGYSVYHHLKQYHVTRPTAVTVTFVSVLFVATTYKFFFHSAWILANLSCALFVFLAALSLWRYLNDADSSHLCIAILWLVAVTLTRIEAGLLLIAVLVPFFSQAKLSTPSMARLAAPTLAFFTLWSSTLWRCASAGLPVNGAHLQPSHVVVIAVATWLAVSTFAVIHHSRFRQQISRIPFILCSALGLLYAGLFVSQPEHGLFTLKSMFANLFLFSGNAYLGHWGYSWWLVVGGLILTSFVPAPQNNLTLRQTALIIALSIMTIVFFRGPYSIGFWDSGNRMMLHIFPLISFYLFITIWPALSRRTSCQVPSSTAGSV